MPKFINITLPRGARNRWYYVIVMPLTAEGHGPAIEGRDFIDRLAWEVWDQELTSHGSFDFLPDAMDFCDELNEEWMKNNGI